MILIELLIFSAILFVIMLEAAFAVFFILIKLLIKQIAKGAKGGPPYPEAGRTTYDESGAPFSGTYKEEKNEN